MKKTLHTAWELFDSGEYQEAESLYLACYDHINRADYENFKAVLMGLIYTEAFLEKYEEARNYGKILLQEARNEEDRQVALHQLGMVERMAGNYAAAMERFREEESVIQAFFPNDPLRMAVNLYERGYVAMKMTCFEKAEKMMQRSLDCAERAEDDMCIGCAYRGMGEIMKGMGVPQAARDYFGKAIASFTKAGDFLAVEEVKKMEETIE